MIPTDRIAGDEDGKTVLIGIKMDGLSKELLTWSLVKVAQPGDLVIALHVLSPNGNYVFFVVFGSFYYLGTLKFFKN